MPTTETSTISADAGRHWGSDPAALAANGGTADVDGDLFHGRCDETTQRPKNKSARGTCCGVNAIPYESHWLVPETMTNDEFDDLLQQLGHMPSEASGASGS